MHRRSTRLVAALLLFPIAAVAQYAQSGRVIANGGTTLSTGGGHELAGTIAEPVAGAASNATYTLDGGFWQPTRTPPGDAIFRNGFED